jgi:hypothetical protein
MLKWLLSIGKTFPIIAPRGGVPQRLSEGRGGESS